MTIFQSPSTRFHWSRSLRLAVAIMSATGIGSAVQAQDLPEFDQRVRDVLMRNPQIILEVFELLESQQRTDTALEDQRLLAQFEARLFAGVAEGMPAVVEFFDYNCGYCRRSAAEVEALELRIDDLQVVHMQFPILGPPSLEMAKLMLGLEERYGREAYMQVHRSLMRSEGNARIAFDSIIADLEYDFDEVLEASQSAAVNAKLAEAQRLAGALGILGTPGFVTRHQIIRGYADADALERAVLGAP